MSVQICYHGAHTGSVSIRHLHHCRTQNNLIFGRKKKETIFMVMEMNIIPLKIFFPLLLL